MYRHQTPLYRIARWTVVCTAAILLLDWAATGDLPELWRAVLFMSGVALHVIFSPRWWAPKALVPRPSGRASVRRAVPKPMSAESRITAIPADYREGD